LVTSFAAAMEQQPGLDTEKNEAGAPVRAQIELGQGKTREKKVLRVRAAAAPRRLAASLVDLALVSVVSLGVAAVAALALGAHLPTAKEFGPDFVMAGLLDRNPMVAGTLGLFVGMSVLYQIYLGGIWGQTLGKRLFRIRVISSHGAAPGPIVACARAATMTLSLLPAGLGFLWCVFDRERRALHDHLSGTYVILDER
jgi:uncharacterized RDD family membrane protein YckC